MSGKDKDLIAEFQEIYTDFKNKVNNNTSLLMDFFHKDIVIYVGENPEVSGAQALVDFITNEFPNHITDVRVTHAERLTPKHVLCELHQDWVNKHDQNQFDKIKTLVLLERTAAGKWTELQAQATTCTPKKDASRVASKPTAKTRPSPQEAGDKGLWAELQGVMDALTSDWNNEPSKTANYWTSNGRMYATGQPVRIGKEGVVVGNSTVRKEGWILGSYYLTFAGKLSEDVAWARANFDLTHEKTREVIYGRTQHIFKKVDEFWRYHAAAW